MRCFGERSDQRVPPIKQFNGPPSCRHASMVALMLGRTMAGMRVYDVHRALDVLGQFPAVDMSRIYCLGHSGGGLVTYYATAFEPRLAGGLVSCAFCSYQASIAYVDHCEDNYLPGVLQYLEMADIAGLIAPRPLLFVNGKRDDIFPLPGVEQAFADVEAIYQWAGAPGKAQLRLGEEGHKFYSDLAWPTLRELITAKNLDK